MPRRTTAPFAAPRLELTPLIDVVFLLLTFFIVALVLTTRLASLDVALPPAGEQPAQTPPTRPAILQINADGSLSLDDTPIDPRNLQNALNELQTSRPDATLLLAPDQDTTTKHLFPVLDALQQAGISDLRFLRQLPADTPQAPRPTDPPSTPAP